MNATDLPKKSDPKQIKGWYLALRPITGANLCALVDIQQRSLYAVEIFPDSVSPELVVRKLRPALKHLAPLRRSGKSKPVVQIEPDWLLEALKPLIEHIGLEAAPAMDKAAADLVLGDLLGIPILGEEPPAGPTPRSMSEVADMNGSLPGLLSIPGVTREQMETLFSAAADFYQAAPWERLIADQALEMFFTPGSVQRWGLLIGTGRDPAAAPGLLIFESRADLEYFFNPGSARDSLPSGKLHSLTFERPKTLPTPDLDAIAKYKWEIASEDAYPLLLTLAPNGAERPGRDELIRIEVALRALPDFIFEQIEVDESGSPLAVVAEYEVQASSGLMQITLTYPGIEDNRRVPAPSKNLGLTVVQVQASRLAHAAWQEQDPEQQLSLARAALEQWPEAADALMVLAEAAEDPKEAVALLERAAAASDRLLTSEVIEASGGDLWDLDDARPYLRARLALAEELEHSSRAEGALRHYLTLLEIGPSDPAGARYPALTLLMRLGRDKQARELLDRYHDDPRSEWRYAEALLAFRSQGDTPEARRLLDAAVSANRLAPSYLTGSRALPSDPQAGRQSFEDEEAVEFALHSYPLWWSTPGAIAWLKKYTAA